MSTSLIFSFYPPQGEAGWKQWTFAESQIHFEIVQAAQKLGVKLPTYQIDPFAVWDVKGWLLRHQGYHSDMCRAFGVEGKDLQSVDFADPKQLRSWMNENYMEMQAVAAFLGIG